MPLVGAALTASERPSLYAPKMAAQSAMLQRNNDAARG